MSSRYVAYEPGDVVPVEVTDDAEPGDLVEISGENDSLTEVQVASDDGTAIGMLVSEDGTTDASVKISKPVFYLNPEADYSATAGDLVAERADGTVADEESDGTSIDKTNAYGQVFSTRVRSLHVGDRVAVAVYR